MEEGVKGETVFLSHKDEVGAVYTDNSRKLIATIGELGYRHQTSTEYVDSSKSFVEREIRHMLEGTRTNLVQSGLPLQYWPMAMQHFSMAVNATPQLNGDDAHGSFVLMKIFQVS